MSSVNDASSQSPQISPIKFTITHEKSAASLTTKGEPITLPSGTKCYINNLQTQDKTTGKELHKIVGKILESKPEIKEHIERLISNHQFCQIEYENGTVTIKGTEAQAKYDPTAAPKTFSLTAATVQRAVNASQAITPTSPPPPPSSSKGTPQPLPGTQSSSATAATTAATQPSHDDYGIENGFGFIKIPHSQQKVYLTALIDPATGQRRELDHPLTSEQQSHIYGLLQNLHKTLSIQKDASAHMADIASKGGMSRLTTTDDTISIAQRSAVHAKVETWGKEQTYNLPSAAKAAAQNTRTYANKYLQTAAKSSLPPPPSHPKPKATAIAAALQQTSTTPSSPPVPPTTTATPSTPPVPSTTAATPSTLTPPPGTPSIQQPLPPTPTAAAAVTSGSHTPGSQLDNKHFASVSGETGAPTGTTASTAAKTPPPKPKSKPPPLTPTSSPILTAVPRPPPGPPSLEKLQQSFTNIKEDLIKSGDQLETNTSSRLRYLKNAAKNMSEEAWISDPNTTDAAKINLNSATKGLEALQSQCTKLIEAREQQIRNLNSLLEGLKTHPQGNELQAKKLQEDITSELQKADKEIEWAQGLRRDFQTELGVGPEILQLNLTAQSVETKLKNNPSQAELETMKKCLSTLSQRATYKLQDMEGPQRKFYLKFLKPVLEDIKKIEDKFPAIPAATSTTIPPTAATPVAEKEVKETATASPPPPLSTSASSTPTSLTQPQESTSPASAEVKQSAEEAKDKAATPPPVTSTTTSTPPLAATPTEQETKAAKPKPPPVASMQPPVLKFSATPPPRPAKPKPLSEPPPSSVASTVGAPKPPSTPPPLTPQPPSLIPTPSLGSPPAAKAARPPLTAKPPQAREKIASSKAAPERSKFPILDNLKHTIQVMNKALEKDVPLDKLINYKSRLDEVHQNWVNEGSLSPEVSNRYKELSSKLQEKIKALQPPPPQPVQPTAADALGSAATSAVSAEVKKLQEQQETLINLFIKYVRADVKDKQQHMKSAIDFFKKQDNQSDLKKALELNDSVPWVVGIKMEFFNQIKKL